MPRAKSNRTPRSRIKAALRALWLRSRERSAALKKTKHCCARCGVKASKVKGQEVKLEVHHLNGIVWEVIMDQIADELLCSPLRLEPLCEKCHGESHK